VEEMNTFNFLIRPIRRFFGLFYASPFVAFVPYFSVLFFALDPLLLTGINEEKNTLTINKFVWTKRSVADSSSSASATQQRKLSSEFFLSIASYSLSFKLPNELVTYFSAIPAFFKHEHNTVYHTMNQHKV